MDEIEETEIQTTETTVDESDVYR